LRIKNLKGKSESDISESERAYLEIGIFLWETLMRRHEAFFIEARNFSKIQINKEKLRFFPLIKTF